MPTLEKNIPDSPIKECPLCESRNYEIIRGDKILFIKKPDSIKCNDCKSVFNIDNLMESVLFSEVARPYSFFIRRLSEWISINECTHLAGLIRENNPEALNYLSGANKYMWRLRIITDSKGDAEPGVVAISMAWDEPETKKQANKQLADIRLLQKRIRQVKREMALDMKEIRAKYGRKKEN